MHTQEDLGAKNEKRGELSRAPGCLVREILDQEKRSAGYMLIRESASHRRTVTSSSHLGVPSKIKHKGTLPVDCCGSKEIGFRHAFESRSLANGDL